MNAKDVAEILNVHPNTIYNGIREGKIRAEKQGKSFEIPDHEVRIMLMKKFHNEMDEKNRKSAQFLINESDQRIERLLGMLHMEIEFAHKDFERDGLNSNPPEYYSQLTKLYGDEHSTVGRILKIVKEIESLEEAKQKISDLGKYADEASAVSMADRVMKEFKEGGE